MTEWLHAMDANGETPMSRGMRCGHEATIDLLLRVAKEDAEGLVPTSVIHKATRLSYVAAVRELIEFGADVDERDENGLTPLHWAVLTGCEDLVRLLTNRGADLSAVADMLGHVTPLTLARRMGCDKIAYFIEEHGGRA